MKVTYPSSSRCSCTYLCTFATLAQIHGRAQQTHFSLIIVRLSALSVTLVRDTQMRHSVSVVLAAAGVRMGQTALKGMVQDQLVIAALVGTLGDLLSSAG